MSKVLIFQKPERYGDYNFIAVRSSSHNKRKIIVSDQMMKKGILFSDWDYIIGENSFGDRNVLEALIKAGYTQKVDVSQQIIIHGMIYFDRPEHYGLPLAKSLNRREFLQGKGKHNLTINGNKIETILLEELIIK